MAPAVPAASRLGSGTTPRANPLPEAALHKEIKSPMVGTFYAAPSPEAAPYISVGQEITAGNGRLHH